RGRAPAAVALQAPVVVRSGRRPGPAARRDPGPLRPSARAGRAAVRSDADQAAGESAPAQLGRSQSRVVGHRLRPEGPGAGHGRARADGSPSDAPPFSLAVLVRIANPASGLAFAIS